MTASGCLGRAARRWLVLGMMALALLGRVPAAWAAAPLAPAPELAPPAPGDDDPLIVEVWTFGPGDHPFTRFGHNAIRIADRRTGMDTAYNFGTFAFGSGNLLGDFLSGHLRYWLSAVRTRSMAAAYRRENRTIEIQRLDLTPEQKRTLAQHLAVNAQPANRDYRYDYFADNCSTRVRDALDAAGVLGGALRAGSRGPGELTLRGHALRMTADEPWLYLALLIVLGPSTDRPIDAWAEAFLPERLHRTLTVSSNVSSNRSSNMSSAPSSSALPAGGIGPPPVGSGLAPRPLVVADLVAFRAARAPVRDSPPSWTGRFLLVGAALGTLMGGLGVVAARRRRAGRRAWPARVAYGLLCAVFGLVVGFLGSFLLLAWMFTPHAVVYRNQNLLLFAPFALALVGLGPGVMANRAGAMRSAFAVAVAGTALCALGLGLKVLPVRLLSWQDNAALIAALLPMWAGLATGARSLARATPR
jgi:Domain of unknown function (DUF4105)